MNAVVLNDEVSADLFALAELGSKILAPAAVYLAQYLPHAGQQCLDKLLRPFFERLAHDGVVCVRNGCGDDLPRLVPAEAVLIHKYAHELGDNERGVGIVYLNDMVLGKGANVAVALHVLANYALHGGGNEEILLL